MVLGNREGGNDYMSKLNEQGLAVLVEEINKSVNTKINETIGSVDTSILATKEELSQVSSKIDTKASENKTLIDTNTSEIASVKESINTKFDKNGGTFSGVTKAQNNTEYTTAQLRNVILSPNDPDNSVGASGDIWIKYSV